MGWCNHQLEIQYLHFGSWNFWETHVARKVVQLAFHLHQLSSEPSISTTCHPSKSGSGRETQGAERKEKMVRQNMGAKLTWKMETLEEWFPFQLYGCFFRCHVHFWTFWWTQQNLQKLGKRPFVERELNKIDLAKQGSCDPNIEPAFFRFPFFWVSIPFAGSYVMCFAPGWGHVQLTHVHIFRLQIAIPNTPRIVYLPSCRQRDHTLSVRV